MDKFTTAQIEAAKIALVAHDYLIHPGDEQAFLDQCGRNDEYLQRVEAVLYAVASV